jgi:hypothetical protein
MKKILLVILALLSFNVFSAGKIQDADVKSLAQLTSAGGTAAQLINDTKIYVSAGGINQQLSTAISGGLIGSSNGGSNSIKEYITNPSAQLNTNGWVTFADAPGTIPVDGTGGTSTLTWTRYTTSPLIGTTADFLLTHTAANEQGMGVSSDYTIEQNDRNKVLGINFSTLLNSGTYTANDIQVFVYDVTNSVLLNGQQAISLSSPTATTGGVVATATVSPHVGSVYIPQTTAAVRFIVFESTANATAYAIQFSKFSLNNNPFTYASLSNDTDWAVYVPTYTAFGTVATTNMQWRRQGTNVLIKGTFIAQAASAAEARVSLPNSIVTLSTLPTVQVAGTFGDNEGSGYGGLVVVQPNVSYLNFSVLAAIPGSTLNVNNSNAFVGAGKIISIDASIPIQGWSATSQNLVTPAKSGIESAVYTGFTSATATNIKFKTLQTSLDPLSTLASVDNTTYTKYTVLKKSLYFVGLNIVGSANNKFFIYHYNQAGTLLGPIANTVTQASGYGGNHLSGIANVGDYFVVFFQDSNPSDVAGTNFYAEFVDFEQQMLSAMPYPEWKTYGLTVTGTGWTTIDAKGIPYKTKDGSWWIKGYIIGSVSSGSRVSYAVTISGLTFLRSLVCVGSNDASLTNSGAYSTAASGVLTDYHTSLTTTGYNFSFDLPLSSKPTFATQDSPWDN